MNALERVSLRVLRRIVRAGTLIAQTPGGAELIVGSGEPRAEVSLHDRSALGDLLRHGSTGFSEAYMDGRLTTPDLAGLLRWGVANHEAWVSSPVARVATRLRRGWLRLRPERRHPRVQTMVDHYDLVAG